jgi:hypothetical protein
MEKYIKEIEDVRENILKLEQLLDGLLINYKYDSNFAVKNWLKRKPNCAYYSSKILRELCEKPGTLKSFILDPIKKWLFDYEINLTRNIPGFNLDTFLRRGIRVIYNFIMIAFFFAQNSNYFTPLEKTKNTKLWILDLISQMSNCTDRLTFIYDRMKRIKNLPEELKNMRQEISDICLRVRLEKLKS